MQVWVCIVFAYGFFYFRDVFNESYKNTTNKRLVAGLPLFYFFYQKDSSQQILYIHT